MRRLSICLLTAATALTAAGSIPAAAYAATGTYNIPGGKIIVNGGFMNGANCGQSFPGIHIPGIHLPGNVPCSNFPCPHFPDNSLPLPEIPAPGHSGDIIPGQPDTGTSQDEFADQVVNLVNEERARAGLKPLSVHGGASGAAGIRAKEIERSFSHTRPDGSSFNTALTAAGVNFRGAGENIAYGQSTPQQVMEGWMNSSGHRANILNANYTSIGVGHYRNASGVDYWTQLFIQ